MNRIFCTVLLCVVATNVYAQLPNTTISRDVQTLNIVVMVKMIEPE